MTDILLQSPLFDKVRTYLTQAKGNDQIFLYVPFINPSVLEKLIEGIDSQIVIITSWNTNHLLSGVSQLELWPFCKKRGIFLYVHKHIHLKIYSVGFENLILASANISKTGLDPSGTFQNATVECAAFIEEISNDDRIYFENILKDARPVDDEMYEQLLTWYDSQEKKPIDIDKFDEIVPAPKKDYFLRSALPMTDSMQEVIQGYLKINSNLPPSKETEIANCIFHDITNYNIPNELSEEEVREKLKKQFLSHLFTKTIMDEIDNHERKHFGKIKNWIRDHCTEVPLPRPWEFNKNTEILMQWLVESGEYEEFKVGQHTQSIRRINTATKIQSQENDEYENKALEILNEPGLTIPEIKKKYNEIENLRFHDEPSDRNEKEKASEFIWHYKHEMDEKIAQRFGLSENEIGERNSQGRLYKKMVKIMGELNKNQLIKMWYYEQKGSAIVSDGVWRLTDKGKQEIQNRGI